MVRVEPPEPPEGSHIGTLGGPPEISIPDPGALEPGTILTGLVEWSVSSDRWFTAIPVAYSSGGSLSAQDFFDLEHSLDQEDDQILEVAPRLLDEEVDQVVEVVGLAGDFLLPVRAPAGFDLDPTSTVDELTFTARSPQDQEVTTFSVVPTAEDVAEPSLRLSTPSTPEAVEAWEIEPGVVSYNYLLTKDAWNTAVTRGGVGAILDEVNFDLGPLTFVRFFTGGLFDDRELNVSWFTRNADGEVDTSQGGMTTALHRNNNDSGVISLSGFGVPPENEEEWDDVDRYYLVIGASPGVTELTAEEPSWTVRDRQIRRDVMLVLDENDDGDLPLTFSFDGETISGSAYADPT